MSPIGVNKGREAGQGPAGCVEPLPLTMARRARASTDAAASSHDRSVAAGIELLLPLDKLAASEAPLTAVLAKMKSSGSGGGLSSSHTQPEGLLPPG